jgi:hypothetical protein
MSEQARQSASERMSAEWAIGLGNCGKCENAANGGCSIVNALADAAGIDRRDAHEAIQTQIEQRHMSVDKK